MGRLIDHNEVACYITSTTEIHRHIDALNLSVDAATLEQFCTQHLFSLYSEINRDLILTKLYAALAEFKGWSAVDGSSPKSEILNELRSLKIALKLNENSTRQEILQKRLIVARSAWINGTLKQIILRRLANKQNKLGEFIRRKHVTDIPSLVLIDAEGSLRAIRETILEVITRISNRPHLKSSGVGFTRYGTRRHLARNILTQRVRQIFRELGPNASSADDACAELLSLLSQ